VNGVLVVNKPEGLTSHDVVARVRKLSHTRKVGHAGTLDPFATGVLVVCLGKATRIVEYFVGCDKEYVATMRLGIATDTQDLTGQTLATRPVPNLSTDELERVFSEFLGTNQQVPPMYSAKKVGGTRLYTLARQGKTVKRAARQITIHSIDILEAALPVIRFRVSCSSGTYIRTLAHDVGEKLGCGAHLTALTRTRSGTFWLEETHPLDRLAAIADPGELARLLIPLDRALSFFSEVRLEEPLAENVTHGVCLVYSGAQKKDIHCLVSPQAGQLCRLYSERGVFLGIGQWTRSEQSEQPVWTLRPRKILIQNYT
jgi:tRNA pseudouridine55 synthase